MKKLKFIIVKNEQGNKLRCFSKVKYTLIFNLLSAIGERNSPTILYQVLNPKKFIDICQLKL